MRYLYFRYIVSITVLLMSAKVSSNNKRKINNNDNLNNKENDNKIPKLSVDNEAFFRQFGYKWREPTIDELNTVNNFLKEIMPIQCERDHLLDICATALNDIGFDKLAVLYGTGNNGKTTFIRLLQSAIGTACYVKGTYSNIAYGYYHRASLNLYNEITSEDHE